MADGGSAQVVKGTAYETLTLLYRKVQADSGLTALGGEWSGFAIPRELRAAADWFFRGDIALGMNVIPFAHTNRWHTLEDLLAGLARTDPIDLATTMLRAPVASRADHRRRAQDVTTILADDAPRDSLLAALHAEQFDLSAAEALLDDPVVAAREFIGLISAHTSVVADHDVAGFLDTAAETAQATVDEHPIAAVAERLFPQWKLEELAEYASVVLIPSAAIAPFVSIRLTPNDQALIVFPAPSVPESSLAELASTLKALAHPQRLEILRKVAQAPATGKALAQALGLTEATVHHHTSLLRAAGLMVSHRDAHRVLLRAAPEALDPLVRELQRMSHTGRVEPKERP